VTFTELTVDEIALALDLGDALEPWRAELDRSSTWAAESALPVPGAAQIEALGERFDFPADVTDALAAHRGVATDAAAQRLVAHAQWRIVERYRPGEITDRRWPWLDGADDPGVRLLWAYASLSLVPHVERLHAERGIEEGVTAATMSDVGRQVRVHRAIFGHLGMGAIAFVSHSLAGYLVALGRLQFQASSWLFGDAPALRPGDPVLDVHIPESGPLDPDSVDASFARARAFFPRHFPEHEARHATCESWLLDPQLLEDLSPESNIVRFQRRFVTTPLDFDIPSRIFRFVFDRDDIEADDGSVPPPVLDTLPLRTTLQRAVVARVRTGGRWRITTGWLVL
jgi:hypothetical protein